MTINLTNLDPNTYKQSLKTFLKTQTVFKDYNFEDSNMSVLLDILSHNTYLNTFLKNMIFAESQLDSAILRSSVISQAKELNYVPQSRKSSKAVVSILIEASGITSLELPKGTQFSGRGNIESYVFTTEKSYIAKSSNGSFFFPSVEIFEGSYFTDTYIVDTSIENQQFIISNNDVDISSISVVLFENNGATETLFNKATKTYGLNPTSDIYFVEGFDDFKYKINFGQNILGRQPKSNDVVIILYRVTPGINEADDVNTFNMDEDIVSRVNGVLNNITINTLSKSSGGAEREDINSIKFNAPRFFSAQEAAITTEDYKSIILKEFSNNVADVSVYGGEKTVPKQYGKTIVAIKPRGSDTLTNTIKSDIYSYIKEYNVGSILPEIIDGDNFYLKINTEVQFKSSETSIYLSDLEPEIIKSIKKYSEDSLEKFDKDFRYSKFVKTIDDTDTSIVSNDTSVKLVKRIIPKTNTNQKFFINFGNELTGLTTSYFTWVLNLNSYKNCYISDKLGILNIVYINTQNTETILESNIGTIDYTTGYVNINKFNIEMFTGAFVEIMVSTKYKDVIMSNEKILNISDNDITINIIEEIV